MEPRLSLRCLGEPILAGPDGEPIRFKVRKHIALLVFLAVEQKARHHRDFLAELLWANLPDRDNRHSLATALSMLRAKVGGDAIEADRDHVRFGCMRMDLDLHRLETGDVLASEFQPALQIAGFLDGFEVPGSAEFMLWRERQRARWLPLVREALVKRIDKCRRTGDFKQIEHLADRMLHLDELSEEAVRAKMEARAFAGDRLTALKVFEAWKERLEEDLGASPSSLVEGMAVRLRQRGWERPSSSPIPAVHTDQWKNRPFVGRANEYQALYEGWERTRRGEPGHAILVGDSGIGKTTLADRLATAAGLEGAVTSRVQCYDLEREIPYATISGLVHGLLDRPGASATPPEALAELARTVPEVRQKYPAIPPSGDSQGETARILLTEAFHQLLTALAEEQPVTLVVDDLHLADDASLAVLHLMMRRARGQPIMVVFATRAEGLEQSPQAARLRESADRLGIRTIELSRMSEEESLELLTSFIPAGEEQPGLAARRALLRAAAGYPMVLELLVQDWQANGERSLALSVEAMTANLAVDCGLSGAYRHLLDRLTGTLDQSARNVLNLAAILGARLNDLLAYSLADLTVGQTMAGMAQLVRLRILRERGDGLEFANELIRAHAYVSVPSPLRRALHGEIAGRLLAEAADWVPRSGLEIAWHCFRGGRPAEGIPYLLSGAQSAIRAGAPHEVELALASAMPSLTGADALRARILLVEALHEQGRWSESVTLIRDTDARGTSQQGLTEVLDLAAQYYLRQIGDDNVFEVLSRLEVLVQAGIDPAVKVRSLTVAALVLYDLGGGELALRFLRLAHTIAPDVLDDESQLRFVVAKSLLRARTPDARSGFSELEVKTGELARTQVASSVAAQVALCASAMHCSLGNYGQAYELAQLAYRIASRLGNDVAAAAAAGNIALCYGRLGSYEEQIRWSQSAWTHLGTSFTGYRDVQIGIAMGFGNAMLGRPEEALRALDQVSLRLPAGLPAWVEQAWHFGRADILQLIGRRKDALAAANPAIVDGILHSHGLAGPFARWVALDSIERRTTSLARERLCSLRRALHTYDAVDQAEILAASYWIGFKRTARDVPSKECAQQRKLAAKLLDLPAAISVQLSRLGPRLRGD